MDGELADGDGRVDWEAQGLAQEVQGYSARLNEDQAQRTRSSRLRTVSVAVVEAKAWIILLNGLQTSPSPYILLASRCRTFPSRPILYLFPDDAVGISGCSNPHFT